MEIGQIYFLLPKKTFDRDGKRCSPALDLPAIAAIASNAKKAASQRRRPGLHASMKQLAPLPQLPSASPPSPGAYASNRAADEDGEEDEGGREDDGKNAQQQQQQQPAKQTASKNSPYPPPSLPHADVEGDDADADEKARFTKEFVQKLLAETKLKLQSAPKGGALAMDPSIKALFNNADLSSRTSAAADKGTDAEAALRHGDGVKISAEMQSAYTRHILDRSFARLWRPPLDTIAEDHQILFLS
jgi:hypothetical protein